MLEWVESRAFVPVEEGIYFIGRRTADKQFPLEFFQVMEQALQEVNPYISHLKRAITIIPREQPLFIEMVNKVAGGEVVAIIHFANVQQMYSRSILIHCSNKLDG